MRGAERPARVKWSRPFLPPLRPLSPEAARRAFFDITDDLEDDSELEKLLNLTDNMPLSITLMANLVSVEGGASVLHRWQTESTSLLSDGPDKLSNLERSIRLSLTSPRMRSTPQAQELLSLLSLMPEGLSDDALESIGMTLSDIPRSKATLIRTSLAYLDPNSRLKVLVPIREYVRTTFPPSPPVISPLRRYLYNIMQQFKSFEPLPSLRLVHLLSADLGNVRSLIQYDLANEGSNPTTASLTCVIGLARFTRVTGVGMGSLEILRSLSNHIESQDDEDLRGSYFLEVALIRDNAIPQEEMILQAIQCFVRTGNVSKQGASCGALPVRIG